MIRPKSPPDYFLIGISSLALLAKEVRNCSRAPISSSAISNSSFMLQIGNTIAHIRSTTGVYMKGTDIDEEYRLVGVTSQ